VGYTPQEVKVGDRYPHNITLAEEKNALNEVVVVGYGTQKKVNLTGSVSSVTFDEKDNRPYGNQHVNRLSGLIPGLAVQQSTSLAGSSQANLFIQGFNIAIKPYQSVNCS
jgi:hypothetical protein